ncbi:MAG: PLP-dependent aminotransferase family protein [Actinomycetota bacterium]|nr:PLP-dependent aminotransferase family protein [Actinomycetota bacterium]
MDARFASRVAEMRGSAIDGIDALLAGRQDIVPFAGGTPNPIDLPVAELASVAQEVLTGSPSTLSYGPARGDDELRAAVLELADAGHETATPDQLLITSGALQALDITFRLLLDPGDLVIVESPTYSDALATLSHYEPNIRSVSVDAEGMVVEDIAKVIQEERQPPKLLYVIPTFQNPTGRTMTLARRETLLEIADRYGAVIVEDDPYHLLRYEGDPVPSVWALDEDQTHVVAVRTFSKIIAPGLRVGWVFAPEPILRSMITARQGMDTCTSPLTQRIVARFLQRGVDERLQWLKATYRRRRDTMAAALREHFADVGADWDLPLGGYFFWLTVPEPYGTRRLLPIAIKTGVSFVPGDGFSIDGGSDNSLRLCFVAVQEGGIPDGIRRLRAAYGQLL